jgi:hypothetical protein
MAHQVETAYERGWASLKNGELIASAEQAGFEVFVTTDSNLRYQQNLNDRLLAIVVLKTTSWPRIQCGLDRVVHAVDESTPGAYLEIGFN